MGADGTCSRARPPSLWHTLLGASLLCALAALGLTSGRSAPALDAPLAARLPAAGPAAATSASVARASAASTPAWPAEVRWLAIGGGADPASNPVSLEQDLALWARTVGPGGVTLFAGGRGRSPVQISGGKRPAESLELRLGELLQPRDGRAAHYQPTRLNPHGDATAPSVLAALRRASNQPSGQQNHSLLVYVAAHGEPGATPRDNRVVLWGGSSLSASELAAALDAAPDRPLRLVMTSCFSGGFAELAFQGADPDAGPSLQDRCGLFASTWDLEASGCDPNPDRRQQESYGLHFLYALGGRDRSGRALPRRHFDLDGDGRITLLEAHTRARIFSRALGVPTTTSERWLRHAAPVEGPTRPPSLPEEQAVIDALAAELDLPSAKAARERLQHLTVAMQRADAHLASLERATDEATAKLRMALLERWPLLDDPYHPDYRQILETERRAILTFLDASPASHAYLQARAGEVDVRLGLQQQELTSSRVERLVRAHETAELAGRLSARGGAAFDHYQRLLRCERSSVDAEAH